MKKSLILISSALLLIAGCAKEQLVDPAVQNGYDGPVTIVGATYEQFATEGETKASFNENGKFGWETAESAKFEITNGWYESTAQDISADKSKCSFQIVGDLSTDMVAVLPANINPVRYNAQSTNDGLKVTIPASRTWVKDQSYATMLGFGANNGGNTSYSFSHLGGLAKIKVNGVPANATKFVFKTKGYKINGEFEAGKLDRNTKQTISTSTVTEADGFDEGEDKEDTYSLTFSSSDITNNSGIMEFNVPLPCGTYSNGFAFCFKNESGVVIYSFVGSSPQKVERTDRLCLPTINIVGGGGENLPTKSVQNIPAGYKGDFLLAEAENVLLKIAPEANANDINLKYNSGQKPSNLEINIVDGETAGTFAGTISGILPDTHVDFTKGTIANVSMTTSTSTFEIIYPATISTKLTVTGGNVKVKGAQVAAIEVAANAVASEETKAPVQIVVDNADAPEFNAPVVTAKANVIVAPAADVTVQVTADDDVKVATEGAGNVTDSEGTSIANGAAQIGDIKYATLADAIAAVKEGETITMLGDVAKANGISVPSGKNFTVDFDNHEYLTEKPGAGSANTKTQAFQLLKGSIITFENGTIGCTEANKNHIWTSGDAVKGVAMIIQNYANLTLENMTIDATNIAQNGDDKNVRYAVSTNHGSTTFSGTTTIITVGNDVAFDSCDSQNSVDEQNYPGKPTVTWDSEGTVTGGIELSGGNFDVKQNLAVDKPIVAIDDDNVDVSESSLTVESGVTISTGANFEDLNPTLSNKHATGLVQVKRGAKLSVSGTGTIDAGDKSKTYSAAYVTVKGDNTEKTATLDVNGTTLKGYYYAIAGNGNRPNTVINLTDAKVYGTSTGDGVEAALGIYHPQMGTLTINGGSTEIKGKASGIEMRAGTLVVNDGKIEGTAVGYTVEANGSGSTTVGAGIAIAPHTTGKDISVTIYEGEIKGNQAISNANPQNQTSEVAVTVNGGTFSDESAIKYAAQNANINIALQANRDASGIFLGQNKNVKVTFDLGGKTLNFVAPAVGSKGTENQAFHIEQGNQLFTLKNGRVTIDESAKTAFRFIIQNYNDLTVHNVELDGSNLGFADKTRYTVSNNQGTVNFTGSTSIKAASENDVAFDVCKYSNYSAPTVTWASTGSVDGIIELSGGTFELGADLCVNAPVYVTSTNKSTLNLKEKKLHNTTEIWEKDSAKKWGELIRVEGGKLEINDTQNGSVAAKVNDCYAVNVREGGELTINGGTYKGNISAVQVVTGTATIQRGSFEQQQDAEYNKFVLNCIDANFKAGTAKIIVKGGSFKGFNPGNNLAEGESTNFVAEGYTSTENNGVWTVSANQN